MIAARRKKASNKDDVCFVPLPLELVFNLGETQGFLLNVHFFCVTRNFAVPLVEDSITGTSNENKDNSDVSVF